jgi:hypothetical protein
MINVSFEIACQLERGSFLFLKKVFKNSCKGKTATAATNRTFEREMKRKAEEEIRKERERER